MADRFMPLMVHGAPLTLRIGLFAGVFGLGIGILLGFLGGYLRGPVDAFIRIISDVFITIPSLAVLVVVASTIKESAGLSVNMMGLIVASLSWMWPTRGYTSTSLEHEGEQLRGSGEAQRHGRP